MAQPKMQRQMITSVSKSVPVCMCPRQCSDCGIMGQCATPSVSVAPLRVTACNGRFSLLCSLGNKKIGGAARKRTGGAVNGTETAAAEEEMDADCGGQMRGGRKRRKRRDP